MDERGDMVEREELRRLLAELESGIEKGFSASFLFPGFPCISHGSLFKRLRKGYKDPLCRGLVERLFHDSAEKLVTGSFSGVIDEELLNMFHYAVSCKRSYLEYKEALPEDRGKTRYSLSFLSRNLSREKIMSELRKLYNRYISWGDAYLYLILNNLLRKNANSCLKGVSWVLHYHLVFSPTSSVSMEINRQGTIINQVLLEYVRKIKLLLSGDAACTSWQREGEEILFSIY